MMSDSRARLASGRLPISTYRLQLHRAFTFDDARRLLPYLAKLGISHCYTSPFLKARPGSTHGYDICDHNELNPEIGSPADYEAFCKTMAEYGMAQIVDFVPNHMGIDSATNRWWRDVLENGRCTAYAAFFDIDWKPLKPELDGRILLPILGGPYGAVLERGELQLAFEDGAIVVHYFEHNLPTNPQRCVKLLRYRIDALVDEMTEEDPHLREYLSIMTVLDHLPSCNETDPPLIAERHREKELARERLLRLVEASSHIREHLLDNLAIFNGEPGKPASFDQLHDLLEDQVYRLAYWRTASHEINYRRFFDINGLAGLRMDDPEVFAATHALILRLIREGSIVGVRLDHIDGLFDPAGYLERLSRAALDESRAALGSEAPPPYLVIEKILSAGESLPADWPIDGTSGYDFLNDLNGLFVDGRNHRAMTRVYRRFTSRRTMFSDVVYESKKLIMAVSMASELNSLAHALNRISERDRHTRDFTLASLRETLQEVVACFPVYRTYLSPVHRTSTDRHNIETAIRRARRRNPAMEPSIFEFLRSVLLPDSAAPLGSLEPKLLLDFTMKFQQYTAPVQAKGFEDTAFYRFGLLLSLSEVGGDPHRFGRSPAEFHEANRRRTMNWPSTMLATASHDTKRGEDARARLNVLSEIPDEWGHQLSRWARVNADCRTIIETEPAPDRNDEYLFYQTLLGVWPNTAPEDAIVLPDDSLRLRLREYMLKAIREAKLNTSWINENPAYESAMAKFVDRTLTGKVGQRFLSYFLPFQRRIAALGMVNSLAQVLLKVVSPGVCDFYQGTELWDLSLVDPDNRHPVDYLLRRKMLDDLEPLLVNPLEAHPERAVSIAALLEHWYDGRIKLLLSVCGLRLRRAHPRLFIGGEIVDLEADGEHADCMVALARRYEDTRLIAVVPRLTAALRHAGTPLPIGKEIWGDTRLLLPSDFPDGIYRNVLTGEVASPVSGERGRTLPIATLLQTCPVAMMWCPSD